MGHDWKKDCEKCAKCGTTRTNHYWADDCEKCANCLVTRHGAHNWSGCVCSVCGKTKHNWKNCKCSACGATRDEAHDWQGCKCKQCGKTRDELHDWQDCICKACGKTDQSSSTDASKAPHQGGVEEKSLHLTGIRSWLQVADKKDSTTLIASQLTLEMMAGITFLANEECVDQLKQAFLLMENHAQEMSWDFAIFMGCLISALLGGKWQRAGDGNYVLGEVGPKNITIDIKRDVLPVIQTDGSTAFRKLFNDVKTRSGS